MTSLALPALGIIAVTLAAIVAIEVSGSTGKRESLHALASSAGHSDIGATRLDETDQWPGFVEISLARPLFEPDRRPATAAIESIPNNMPRLAGIIVTPTVRCAIFVQVPGDRTIVAMQGARINNFIVQSIDGDAVTIVTSDGAQVLHPSFATSKPGSNSGISSPVVASAPPALVPPPATSGQALPFASIPGLNGRPLGLSATPDQTSSPAGAALDISPSVPPRAPSGSSP